MRRRALAKGPVGIDLGDPARVVAARHRRAEAVLMVGVAHLPGRRGLDRGDDLAEARAGHVAAEQVAAAVVFGDLLLAGVQEDRDRAIHRLLDPPVQRVVAVARRDARRDEAGQPALGVVAVDVDPVVGQVPVAVVNVGLGVDRGVLVQGVGAVDVDGALLRPVEGGGIADVERGALADPVGAVGEGDILAAALRPMAEALQVVVGGVAVGSLAVVVEQL